MVDIDKLRDFIADMPGDQAAISRDNLIAIERELREGRAAAAMARAERQIMSIAEQLGQRAA